MAVANKPSLGLWRSDPNALSAGMSTVYNPGPSAFGGKSVLNIGSIADILSTEVTGQASRPADAYETTLNNITRVLAQKQFNVGELATELNNSSPDLLADVLFRAAQEGRLKVDKGADGVISVRNVTP